MVITQNFVDCSTAKISAGADPQLHQLALTFLATFLVVNLLYNDRLLVFSVHEVHLYGPLYIALSSLTLPFTPTYTALHNQ